MSVVVHKEILPGCRLGIWQITEDYDTLRAAVYLNEDDIVRLDGFKNLNRKIESLSVRALLQQMADPKARIVYNESRKPFLADGSYNISISHSHAYTTILLAKKNLVGIDMEFMSHNMDRVEHKFINRHEQITDDPVRRATHQYVHWCAKEALYKICDKEDINFQYNLTIKPFDIADEGDIIGVVRNNFRNEEYKMHYQTYDRYVLVYCVK